MPEDFKESEWNEANLKMKRLHDAQERINYYKRDAKGMTDGKFNYEWWIKDIEVLYGEGHAKYSLTEITTVDRLKKLTNEKLRLSPPHSSVRIGHASGVHRGWIINENSLRVLLSLIESFEETVKQYNDKHGLSTKNRGTGGLF